MNRIAITVLTLMMSSLLAAEHGGRNTDWAKVTGVDPVYDDVPFYEPIEICHDRQIHGHRSHTGPLFGAVIGGAIGNELGHHKSNQRVGALIGALLGASIASDIGHSRSRHHRSERFCETVEERKWRREIVAYNVRYKYRGREYSTVMDYDPGERIKVAVDVKPLG